jgi:toxin ParE1/3/4
VADLEYLEEAVVEAAPAAEWYAARSATAAGFETELAEAESAIHTLPHAWPPYDHGTRRYLLRRYPFGVVYRIERTRILIVAVAHGHRRPAYWRDRM